MPTDSKQEAAFYRIAWNSQSAFRRCAASTLVVDHANPAVAVVRDVQVTARIQPEALMPIHLCAGRWTAIVRRYVAACTRLGDGVDDSTADLADAEIIGVCDVEVSACIHGKPLRQVETRTGCRTAIPAIPGAS